MSPMATKIPSKPTPTMMKVLIHLAQVENRCKCAMRVDESKLPASPRTLKTMCDMGLVWTVYTPKDVKRTSEPWYELKTEGRRLAMVESARLAKRGKATGAFPQRPLPA